MMSKAFPIMSYSKDAILKQNCIINDKIIMGNTNIHGHDYIEIELFVSGKGNLQLNNETISLEAGILYLVSPEDFHRVSLEKPCRIISIHIKPEIIEKIGLKIDSAYIRKINATDLERTVKQLTELSTNFIKNEPYCEQNLFARTILLIVELLKNGFNYKLSGPEKRFQKALMYIQNNYTNPSLSLEEISSNSNYSANYFSTLFTQTVGYHFSDYITECRLNHSCALLEATDKSITEIAYDSGFATLSHFFRCFKKAYGLTPNQYRMNGQNLSKNDRD